MKCKSTLLILLSFSMTTNAAPATTNLNDRFNAISYYDITSEIDLQKFQEMLINLDNYVKDATQMHDMSVKALAVKNISVKPIQAYIINIEKSKFDIPKIVIDSTSFKINVTEQTYSNLRKLRLVYDFEEDRSTTAKAAAQLADLKRTELDIYIKWLSIFNENRVCNIQFLKNRTMHSIVGEAWLLNNNYTDLIKANLKKNLQFFKKEKYDSVLVRFDCTEDLNTLVQMIDDIKSEGFDVFAAYVGKDGRNPRWNPFIDPEVLETYIQCIAPKCVGFFLNWRGTSNHSKILPAEFFNYMCNTLRKHNGKIFIYGEIFYGRIDPYGEISTVIYTAPDNVTGVVVNNMGYYANNIPYAISTLFYKIVPQYGRMEKIGQVIGFAPYYRSRPQNYAGLRLENEYMYKHVVEETFRKAGCNTITLSHDGVDDDQTELVAGKKHKNVYPTTDNILYDTTLTKQTNN